MDNEISKLTDSLLYETVSNVCLKYKINWERELNSKNINSEIHITKKIPHLFIKEAREYFGLPSEHIATKTDCGLEKSSNSDGGVVYVDVNGVRLPLAWFETKASFSCTNGDGQRGQATGLIGEQAERCRTWSSCIRNKIKPLVAVMCGTDFDESLGQYNINRIQLTLHTRGNVNPYSEGNDDCVSWLFYQKTFSDKELKEIVKTVIETNIKKMKEIIGNFKIK